MIIFDIIWEIIKTPFEIIDLILGGSGNIEKHIDKTLDKMQDNGLL